MSTARLPTTCYKVVSLHLVQLGCSAVRWQPVTGEIDTVNYYPGSCIDLPVQLPQSVTACYVTLLLSTSM